MKKVLTKSLILVLAATGVMAQQSSNTDQSDKVVEQNIQSAKDKLTKEEAEPQLVGGQEPSKDPYQGMMPAPPSELNLDATVRDQYNASLKAYYEYRTEGLKHRSRVFMWQFISSVVIFIVVILLVGVGIYFSWVQFTNSQQGDRVGPLKRKKLTRTLVKKESTSDLGGNAESASPHLEDETKTESAQVTQIEASLQGIKVSSPVLGVIILTISLLFFYLYLYFVYPIENVL